MRVRSIIRPILLLVALFAIVACFASCGTETEQVEGITFEDMTVTYDGTEHAIVISGELPEGVSVSYETNTGTDAGTYRAKATISGDGYETLVLEATLTIEKAEFSGISLEDLTAVYDGTEKSVSLVGALPEGTRVGFYNNYQVNAGVYEVTATLTNNNFNTFVTSATLTIMKADITDITFPSATYTYDGTEKVITVAGTLPDGVNVSYTDNKGTDAGEYQASAILSGNNYNELTLHAVLTVSPAKITGVTLGDGEFTYDGTAKSIAVSGLPKGAEVTYEGNGKTDVGVYTVTATVTKANYETLVLTATLTVEKAKFTGISFDSGSFTWDGNDHSLSIDGTLPEGAEVVYEGNGKTDAGIYTVTATVTKANYETLVLTATLTVEKAKFTGISFDSGSFTWDGSEHSLSIDGTLPEGAEVAYEGNGKTDVGEYTVTATVTKANYETLVLTATLTVEKAKFNGISFDSGSFTWDGSEHSLSIDGTLPEGAEVAYEGNGKTDVGVYTVKATVTMANYETLVLTATLTIKEPETPDPIEITGVEFDNLTVTYDGTEKIITITGTLPDGVSVTYENNRGTNAGTYYATATISGEGYITKTLNATLVIDKADIDLSGISFDNVSVTFDGTEKVITITGTLPEGVSVTYDSNRGTNAGTYNATATLTGDNYKTKTLNATLVIDKADIDLSGISFDDVSVTYDGTEKIITITGTLPDGVSVTYENNRGTNAGTYYATATISGEGYITKTLNATLVIDKADIDLSGISFDDVSVTFDGTEKVITITGTLPEGVSVTYENNSGTNAGTYNATATLSGDNYKTKTLNATLTVKKASLEGTVALSSLTFIYDGNKHTIGASNISGLDSIKGSVNIQLINNERTEIGSQTVTAIITADNYETLTLTATLTVKAESNSGSGSGILTPPHYFG